MSVNKVILLGNVGRDPLIRYVEKRPIAEFSLATTEKGTAGSPERTEWHNLVDRKSTRLNSSHWS